MAKTKPKTKSKSSNKPKALGKLHFLSFKSLMAIAFAVLIAAGGTVWMNSSYAYSPIDENPWRQECPDSSIARRGSSSYACAKRVQWYLRQKDWNSGYWGWPKLAYSCANIAYDGAFGPATEAALKYYQSTHYYKSGSSFPRLSADGIAGPKTWNSFSYGYRWNNTPEPC
jgi:hypothetical protein